MSAPARPAVIDPHVRALYWLAAIVLAVSQTFCNGPDGIAGVVIARTGLSLASLAAILFCAGWIRIPRFSGDDVWIAGVLAGIGLLAIIQLTPLPARLWAALSGRLELAGELAGIGATIGWHPLSMNPLATERSLLALLPAIAIFLASRALTAEAHIRLLRIAIGIGLMAALLGIAQVAAGPDSDLRLYRPSNLADAVGFFANRNHQAGLLAMLLPFTADWAIGEAGRGGGIGSMRSLRVLAACAAGFLLTIGILLTHSRAGLLLIALAGIGVLAQLWRSGAGSRAVLAVGVCGLIAGLLALQIAGNGVLSRLGNLDLGSDTRWPVQATTIAAAQRYGIFGSGLGTFVNAYQSVAPEYQVEQEVYVNHANNDYLELWLETGWPGVLLVGMFGLWYARVAFMAWRPDRTSGTATARAASIALALALTHAAFEYQLRKPAILVLFGLCCAFLSAHAADLSSRASRPDSDRARRRRSSGEKPAAGAVRR